MDTFDMLAPKYDNPQNVYTLKKWMKIGGFKILSCSMLVCL